MLIGRNNTVVVTTKLFCRKYYDNVTTICPRIITIKGKSSLSHRNRGLTTT